MADPPQCHISNWDFNCTEEQIVSVKAENPASILTVLSPVQLIQFHFTK